VGERLWPFLIPGALVLAVRLVDGRLWRVNTVSVVLLCLSVPLGMVVPMAVLGSPMGYLRYLVYVLFAAAGWGLYEIALSRRRRRAVALVLGGWILAVPATVWMMASPSYGLEERYEVSALAHGVNAFQTYHKDTVGTRAPIAEYLNRTILPRGEKVLFDFFLGAPIAMQVKPEYAERLVVTYDRSFKAALAHPARHGVRYMLLPNPGSAPQDAVARTYPRLWDGDEPGFRLKRRLFSPQAVSKPEEWRLYEVLAGWRKATGGAG
jgi:hypothetical protein